MKKKIASLLLICVSMFVFAGCSPDAKAYLEDVKKVNTWNSAEVDGKMSISLAMPNEPKIEMPVTVHLDGVNLTQSNPLLSYKVTFGDVKGLPPEANNLLNGKTVEYFFDVASGKLAYSKDILLNIDKNSATAVRLSRLNERYLGMDLNKFSGEASFNSEAFFAANKANGEKINKIMDLVFGDLDHKLFDVKKNGNSYHYEISGDDVVDGLLVALKHMDKKLPSVQTELVALLKEMDVPVGANELQSLKEAIAELEKNTPKVKEMLKEAKIVSDITYNADSYVTKGTIHFVIEGASFDMSYDLTTKKNDTLQVSMPTDIYYMLPDQLNMLFMPKVDNYALIDVDGALLDDDGMLKDNRTLVPYRAFAEKIDAKVGYDNKSKQIKVTKDGKIITLTIGSKKAMINGKVMMMDTMPTIKDGRTYVPLRFVGENYGYKTTWDKATRVAYLKKNIA